MGFLDELLPTTALTGSLVPLVFTISQSDICTFFLNMCICIVFNVNYCLSMMSPTFCPILRRKAGKTNRQTNSISARFSPLPSSQCCDMCSARLRMGWMKRGYAEMASNYGLKMLKINFAIMPLKQKAVCGTQQVALWQ